MPGLGFPCASPTPYSYAPLTVPRRFSPLSTLVSAFPPCTAPSPLLPSPSLINAPLLVAGSSFFWQARALLSPPYRPGASSYTSLCRFGAARFLVRHTGPLFHPSSFLLGGQWRLRVLLPGAFLRSHTACWLELLPTLRTTFGGACGVLAALPPGVPLHARCVSTLPPILTAPLFPLPLCLATVAFTCALCRLPPLLRSSDWPYYCPPPRPYPPAASSCLLRMHDIKARTPYTHLCAWALWPLPTRPLSRVLLRRVSFFNFRAPGLHPFCSQRPSYLAWPGLFFLLPLRPRSPLRVCPPLPSGLSHPRACGAGGGPCSHFSPPGFPLCLPRCP